ncbi:MAG TPA: entericidin A/B family lipoprotein [Gammaproteobacteria bacterium]|nr:entericidin A/B family lipoprotein [Gammaproteobacteria bacterium]
MKSKLLHWLSAPLALLTLALTLSACNTMEGVGEDVESAGRGIDKSAERSKGY